MKVTGLFVYPIKSCKGFAIEKGEVTATGFKHDRQWMVVDSDGVFLSQRKYAKMALIYTGIDEAKGVLHVWADGVEERLSIKWDELDGEMVDVEVWGDACKAYDAGDAAARWFSGFLGGDFRLVYKAQDVIRQTDLDFTNEGEQTGFSDGFAFLITSEASLNELNGRMDEGVPMARFRANIVVNGEAGFDEDYWLRLRVGEMVMRVVKPCGRCKITEIDHETGEVKKAKVLTELAKFRRWGKSGVFFGTNLMADGVGEIVVGGEVVVLERLEVGVLEIEKEDFAWLVKGPNKFTKNEYRLHRNRAELNSTYNIEIIPKKYQTGQQLPNDSIFIHGDISEFFTNIFQKYFKNYSNYGINNIESKAGILISKEIKKIASDLVSSNPEKTISLLNISNKPYITDRIDIQQHKKTIIELYFELSEALSEICKDNDSFSILGL